MEEVKQNISEPYPKLEKALESILIGLRKKIEEIPEAHKTNEVISAIYYAKGIGSNYVNTMQDAELAGTYGADDPAYNRQRIKPIDDEFKSNLEKLFKDYGLDVKQTH